MISKLRRRIKSLFSESSDSIELSRKELVVTIRAQIYPEIGGTQSLIVDTPEERVEGLASYLGNEPEVVEWLMNKSPFKGLLFDKLFHAKENISYFTSVQEPFTRNRENPGDIDMISFSSSNEAIAFECKVVKATSLSFNGVKINKAEKLEKGAIQANHYLRFGFSQVYFLVIILDDGRHYNKPNFIFNKTSNEDLYKVFEGNWKNILDKEIGIIYCTVEQTRNLSIDETNNVSLQIDRFARNIKQNIIISEKVTQLNDSFNFHIVHTTLTETMFS